MKKRKKGLSIVLSVLILLTALPFVLMESRVLQTKVADALLERLTAELPANVRIDSLAVIPSRLQVEVHGLALLDTLSRPVVQIRRFDGNVRLLPWLMDDVWVLNNIHLSGMRLHLRKDTPSSPLNLSSLLSSTKEEADGTSGKSGKGAKALSVQLKSMMIRDGLITYDVLSRPVSASTDLNHLSVSFNTQLSASFALTPEEGETGRTHVHADVALNKFNLDEVHGFSLRQIRMKAVLDDSIFTVQDLGMDLPRSSLSGQAFSLLMERSENVLTRCTLTQPIRLEWRVSAADLPTLSQAYRQMGMSQEVYTGSLRVNGSTDRLDASLTFRGDSLFCIDGQCRAERLLSDAPSIETSWSKLGADAGLVDLLTHLMPSFEAPPVLTHVGHAYYKGVVSWSQASMLTLDGTLETALGDLMLSGQYAQDTDSVAHAAVRLSAEALALEKLDLPPLSGPASFDMALQGSLGSDHGFAATADIDVHQMALADARLSHVTLHAEGNDRSASATLVSDDENCRLNLSAAYDRRTPVPQGQVRLEVGHADLHRLGLLESSDGQSSLSLRMATDLNGQSLETLMDKLHFEIEDLSLRHNGTHFGMNRLTLVTGHHAENSYLQLQSPVVNGRILGTGSCLQMVEDLMSGVGNRYLPALIAGRPWKPADGLYQFHFQIRDTRALSESVGLPFLLDGLATLDGEYNNETGHFQLALESSDIHLSERRILMPSVRLDNASGDRLSLKANGGMLSGGQKTAAALTLDLQPDSIDLYASWTDLAISPQGALEAHAGLHRSAADAPLSAWISLASPGIRIDKEDWVIEPSKFHICNGRLALNDIKLLGRDRYVLADGVISSSVADTLRFDVKGFRVDDVFDIITDPAKEKPFVVGGAVTAKGTAVSLLGTPRIAGTVHADSLTLVHRLLGDVDAVSWWNDTTKTIEFDAVVSEVAAAHGSAPDSLGNVIPPSVLGLVRGRVFPSESILQMDLNSTGVPMDLVTYYTLPTLSITGPTYGHMLMNISLNGGDISLDGHMLTHPGRVYIHPTGTTLLLDDTVRLSPKQIAFDHARLTDGEGHSGRVNGLLTHDGEFADIHFDLHADLEHFKSLDLPRTADADFFGKVYAGGSLALSGTEDDLHLDLSARTESPSAFTFALGSSSVGEYEFIRFEPLKARQDTVSESQDELEEIESTSALNVNLQLEVTDGTEVSLLTNSATGDGLHGRGNGKIRIEYDNNDVALYGDYILEKGDFSFNLRDILQRNFNIEQGSRIRFAGDPLSAQFDVTTSYQVKGADLSTLLSEDELSSLNLTRTTIPVNCMLYLSGELQQPEIRMDLSFPNAGQEVERSIRSVVNTEEAINRQVVYLLLLNAFVPNENASDGQTGSANANAVFGATLNTLTAQLNRLLYDAIGSDRFSLGFNYNENINTGTNEWQVAMSTSWFDNRLTINGNIGQREDYVSSSATTQFIGDFDLEYILTRRLRLKAYSHANDSRSFKSAMNTQGIGIIIKDSFNSLRELWRNWGKSASEQKKKSFSYSDF